MNEFEKKIVCVDLETTHLDFQEGRIMEVAAVRGKLYFDGQKAKVAVKFEDEFSSLINPEIEVPPTARELTGIKADDLKTAPLWKDVKAKFESFIRDESVVGHNIGFDLGYLANQGASLKNEVIDTLELSQTLLPVISSHSLEALAENLGVQIGVSHRALEDCKTSALVLAEILNQFLLLPESAQKQIRSLFLAPGRGSLGIIGELPSVSIRGTSIQKSGPPSPAPLKIDFPFRDKVIYTLPISFSSEAEWLSYLAGQDRQAIIGLSNQYYLDDIPPDRRLASPTRALCTVKFSLYLKNENLSFPAKRIIAKILIYRHYFKSLDLGRVTFNPEERLLISRVRVDSASCPVHKCEYYQSLFIKPKKNYFAALGTIFRLLREWKQEFKNQRAMLFDMAEIEEGLIGANSFHLTLKDAREFLGVLYPVDESGLSLLAKMPKEGELFLDELDLFFGILHLVYLKRKDEYSETLVLDDEERQNPRFQKIVPSAEKFIKKTEEFNGYLENKKSLESGEVRLQMTALQEKLGLIKNFFSELFISPDPEKLYWLRFNSEWVDLNSAPRDLRAAMNGFLSAVESLSIVDTELARLSLDYFISRLGVENFEVSVLPHPRSPAKAAVKFLEPEFTPESLGPRILERNRSSIVIVSNQSQLLKFFEFFTQDEALRERLVSYKYSGGLGNVRRKLKNLTADSKPFVFLLTTNAASRYFREFPYADDLYVQKIPFEAPSAASPARRKHDARSDFVENALPRALYILNSFLTRFVSEQKPEVRQEIFFADRRIATDYDQAFLNYLQNLSGVEVEL